jgi:hypothetical protein
VITRIAINYYIASLSLPKNFSLYKYNTVCLDSLVTNFLLTPSWGSSTKTLPEGNKNEVVGPAKGMASHNERVCDRRSKGGMTEMMFRQVLPCPIVSVSFFKLNVLRSQKPPQILTLTHWNTSPTLHCKCLFSFVWRSQNDAKSSYM